MQVLTLRQKVLLNLNKLDRSNKYKNLQMKLKKNIATSESGFVFNPSSGDSFSLNTIGAEILLQMKESKSSEEIKKDILNRYNVDKSILERDWDDFMSQLKDNNLLEF